MKKSVLPVCALLAGASVALLGAAPANASSDKPVIALSNAYYGNTWRHQMVESFDAAAKQAKQEGKIADYIVLNGDSSVNQQMSQVAELILKHVDVIAIDAASESALNGVVQKACRAGIKVVAFDSILSAPCAYTLNFDFFNYQAEATEWIAKRLNDKGNVLVVRGVKGSAPDHDMYEGQMSVLKKHPEMKVVATVYGEATTSVAQSAVANILPSLSHVDGVLDQGGGDDFGIAQAFTQYGGSYGDHLPIIEGGGSSNFIHWWINQHKKNGYSTISLNTTPGIGGAAFWLSYEIVKGVKPPKKDMIMPVARVTDENLMDFANLAPGLIVSPSYSEQWVVTHLIQGQKG
jgi:ribose transport system substrate-binding protein